MKQEFEGIQARIRGRVQGVCFRASTADKAKALGLNGWVRNLPDGRVELQAWGAVERLEQLQAWLHQGPAQARVDELEIQACPAGQHTGFEIRY